MSSFAYDLGYTDAQLELAARLTFTNRITSFSPYIMGPWFDAVLLGIVIVLYIDWMQAVYSTERLSNKILLIYLLLVSLGTSAFVLNCEMVNFVVGYGEYKQFLNPRWYRIFWLLNVVSRVPAASFFAHRAWLLSKKSIFVPLTIIPLMVASVGCAIAAYFTSAQLPIPLDSPERILVTLFVVAEVASDLITTLTIAVQLYRSRTGWSKTDRIISQLLIVLAETQLPPTCAAITFLIAFLGWPNNTVIFAFNGIAKVHIICLVIVVNSRVKLNIVGSGTQASNDLPSHKDRLEISVERQTYTDEDKRYASVNNLQLSAVSGDQLRSINGQIFEQQKNMDHYRDTNSKTSLV